MKKITIYSTPTCHFCHMAKDFFTENGLAYTDKNAAADPIARREAIEKLEFDKIKSTGYIALSEIAYQLFKKGIKFTENKSIFINRRRGNSNFSLKEIKESFLAVLRIKKEIK